MYKIRETTTRNGEVKITMLFKKEYRSVIRARHDAWGRARTMAVCNRIKLPTTMDANHFLVEGVDIGGRWRVDYEVVTIEK